ncbi:hypothetical protein T07_11073 [Trichinella nelsoni]|uniref:Uncharacterized protein n=1 Tax=Trichinella nelsoni TaxID=6336 RepID=A0A0V0S7C4_9BILA|nr:hypothetical protein T07_11073 [Trichinella nelsoni]
MFHRETEEEDRPEALVKINESNCVTEREARCNCGPVREAIFLLYIGINQQGTSDTTGSSVFDKLDDTIAESDALQTKLLTIIYVPLLNVTGFVMPFGLRSAPAKTLATLQDSYKESQRRRTNHTSTYNLQLTFKWPEAFFLRYNKTGTSTHNLKKRISTDPTFQLPQVVGLKLMETLVVGSQAIVMCDSTSREHNHQTCAVRRLKKKTLIEAEIVNGVPPLPAREDVLNFQPLIDLQYSCAV